MTQVAARCQERARFRRWPADMPLNETSNSKTKNTPALGTCPSVHLRFAAVCRSSVGPHLGARDVICWSSCISCQPSRSCSRRRCNLCSSYNHEGLRQPASTSGSSSQHRPMGSRAWRRPTRSKPDRAGRVARTIRRSLIARSRLNLSCGMLESRERQL